MVMVAQHCEYRKNHWVVYIKIVNHMLYEFNLKLKIEEKLEIGSFLPNYTSKLMEIFIFLWEYIHIDSYFYTPSIMPQTCQWTGFSFFFFFEIFKILILCMLLCISSNFYPFLSRVSILNCVVLKKHCSQTYIHTSVAIFISISTSVYWYQHRCRQIDINRWKERELADKHIEEIH